MSDNESYDDYSVDAETQLQPEDTLDWHGVEDILDEGYSPPEKPRGVTAFGTTVSEQHQGESLEQRLQQEEPDPSAAFDDPLAEDADEDPDAVREEDEFLDDSEVGDRRSGRLVGPDEGAHEDEESDLVAGDVGIDGAGASAEEAAMHVVDGS